MYRELQVGMYTYRDEGGGEKGGGDLTLTPRTHFPSLAVFLLLLLLLLLSTWPIVIPCCPVDMLTATSEYLRAGKERNDQPSSIHSFYLKSAHNGTIWHQLARTATSTSFYMYCIYINTVSIYYWIPAA